MQTKYVFTLLAGLLFYMAAFSQVPANDECSTAVTITVGTTVCTNPVSGTTHNATQSSNLPLPYCSNDGINDDIWYKLTPTSSGVLNLNFTNATTASYLFAMVYTGTCNNLSDYYCSYGNLNNQIIVTQGTDYYIRVFSMSPDPLIYNDFTVCAFMSNNDECNTAETITVSAGGCTDQRLGTTQYATESNTTPLPACGGTGYNDDVWYKFTAAANGIIYVKVSGLYPGGDVSVQTYSGNCNTLTQLNCNTASNTADNYVVVNATAGTEYFIRVFTPGSDPLAYYNFIICAYTVVSPVNDECSTAEQLTPEINACTSGFSTKATIGATTSADTPLPTCNNTGFDDDVWFKIHSDSTGIMRVEFQYYSYYSNSSGLVLQTYSGTCGSLTNISCNSITSNSFFDINVTAGNDYYIRAFSPENNAVNFSVFGICPYYMAPVPVNNECNNAVVAPVNSGTSCSSFVSGSTFSASESLPGCGGDADDDIWYQFTATATSHKITVTPVTASSGLYNAEFEVFSGACSSVNSLNCVNNTTGYDPEVETLTGLTIGNTYYVRIYSFDYQSGQGDFDICITSPVTQPPANDECTGAAGVTINNTNTCTSVTIGNTVSATQSLTGCTGNADDDVWYSFVAAANSHKITVTPAATDGLNNAVFQIFSGTCASLSSLSCVNNTTGTGAEEETITGLIIGNTYYVRVYSFDNSTEQGAFGICITSTTTLPPPANDECSGAIPLSVSINPSVCTEPVSGTTISATQTLPGCNGTFADDDVWYSFVAQSNQTLITVTPAATNGLNEAVLQVFNGSCVLSGGVCYNDPGSGNYPVGTTFNTTPGFAFTVRVYSATNGTQGDFTICASAYNPINDNCEGAVNVPINSDNSCTITTTGTTVHTTFDGPGTCLAANPAAWDVWYKFTATSTEHIITVTPTAVAGINDAVVSFYAGNGITCANITGGGQCYNNTTGAAAESFTEENLIVGETYYFRVFSFGTGAAQQGGFIVCINTNPVLANDDCSGAITIPENNDASCSNTYQGTSVGSTNSQVVMCGNGSPRDVWYKFVANASAYNINITPATSGGIIGPQWELLSGSCSNLISQGCSTSASTYENLVIGNTYYLRVVGQGYQVQYQGAFIICVKQIILANDVCAGAVNVPVSNDVVCVSDVTGTTTGTTISVSSGLKDVWYKFTATEAAHKIKVSPTADSIRNVAFEVYSGSCNSLTSIAYVDIHNSISNADTTKPEVNSVENLITGTTYYLRVFSNGVFRNGSILNLAGSFNVCVSLSANDVCTQARIITVNANANCNAVTIDSTDHCTPSLNLNADNNCNTVNQVNDSWFTFTALDTAELITITPISGNIMGWALLSGSCGTLTPLVCNAGIVRRIFGGLNIGETYYLRVYSSLASVRAKFSICISKAAINNECSGAVSVMVNTGPGCSIITNGSTGGATPSAITTFTCSNFYYYPLNHPPEILVGNDVWYKFVATSTQYKVTVTGTTPDLNLFFTVYSGDCNSLNTIVCVNDYVPISGSTDEEAVALDNLVIGNTYYIRVYNQAGLYTTGDFTICIGNVDPLNDLCNNAITVPVNSSPACTLSVTGNNTGATRSYDAPVWDNNQYDYLCIHVGNADVFYKFIATSSIHQVTITPTSSGGIDDVMFQIYSGGCGSLSQIAYIDESSGSQEERNTLFNLIPGNTYFIRVANGNGLHQGRGSFTICITAPIAANDASCDAIAIAVNNTIACTLQTSGTTVGATPTNGQQDVWYKFVATASEYEITVTAGTLNNPVFALFKDDCNNLMPVREEIDHDAAGWGIEFQAYDSLVPGNTYYVRVKSRLPAYPPCAKYASFNTTGTFSICVSAPTLLNDLIDHAIDVPVNNGTPCTTAVTGTNVGSSYSGNYSECYRTHMNFVSSVSDVWYKFTATATSHIITVSPTATGSIGLLNYAVFERLTPGAEGLKQRGCVNLNGGNVTETQSLNGLVIGRLYYIRVMSGIHTTSQGSFTICITTAQLPSDDSKIITFAGGGTGEGISAANSQLYKPTDVGMDGSGNVYIADGGYIKKINKADGVVSIVAGTGVSGSSGDGGPATSAQIPLLCKVAADKFGNVFIGDYDRSVGRIRKISSSGIIATIYTLPTDPFPGEFDTVYHVRAITGITTDVSGNLYFTVNRDENHFGELWNWSNVYKLTPSGTLTQLSNTGQFDYGVTVDAAGNVYFVEQYFDPFYNNVYYRYIRKIDAATGLVTTVAGTETFGYAGDGGPAAIASLKPYDVKADAAGNLYIADGNGFWNGEYGNYSIRKITPSGIISTIAGTSVNDYSGDNGPATLAAMHTPVSLAVDTAGNIYIADVKENENPVMTANRIRKIIPNCSGGIAMSNMGNTFYVNAEKIIYKDCDTIAKVAPVAPIPFNRDITAKVWIEQTVPLYNGQPYVVRHYEIAPLTEPASSTVRVTLYFTQADFTTYNATVGNCLKLPIDAADAANNKANLLLIKRDSVSNNGTGLQETYSGAAITINPADNDIVWNATENRWEVSFETTGPGGFFVHTTMVAPTVTLIQPTCDIATGTITVTAPTGMASYTVTGTSPVTPPVTQPGLIFAGLTPGTYDVTTVNSEGCISLALSVTVKLDKAYWTGTIDDDWNKAGNWSTGQVPTASTHVFIPTGTSPCRIRFADAHAASVLAQNSTTLEVMNDWKIIIHGACATLPAN